MAAQTWPLLCAFSLAAGVLGDNIHIQDRFVIDFPDFVSYDVVESVASFVESPACGGDVITYFENVISGFSARIPSLCIEALTELADAFPFFRITADSLVSNTGEESEGTQAPTSSAPEDRNDRI